MGELGVIFTLERILTQNNSVMSVEGQVQDGEEQRRSSMVMMNQLFQGFADVLKAKEKKKKSRAEDSEGENEEEVDVEEGNHPSELVELGLHQAKLDPFVKHLINTQRRIIFGVGQKKVVVGVYSADFLHWLKQGGERFEGKYEFLKERYLACCQCPLLGDAILRVGELSRNMDGPGPLGVTETEKKFVRIALCELLALYLGRRLESEGEVAMLFTRFSCPVVDLTSMTKAQVLALTSESLACMWLRRWKKPRTEIVPKYKKEDTTWVKGGMEKPRQGPVGGCFTCGGDHFRSDCPKAEHVKGKPVGDEGKNSKTTWEESKKGKPWFREDIKKGKRGSKEESD